MDKKIKLITGVLAVVMIIIFLLVLIFGALGSDKAEGESILYSETTSQKDQNPSAKPEHSKENLNTEPEEKNSLTLSFIGDCIIGSESGKINDGNFSYMAANSPHSYFFSQVVGELSKDDFTIANVECVLTDRDLEKVGKDYDPAFWYKAPTSSTDILTLGSVEVASVVNNHVGDYGDEGYSDTVDALKAHGLQVGENLTPLYIEKNGVKIGLLSCNLWSSYNVSYIEEVLETMQDKCDYKIVFFHGGTEGTHKPDNYKIDACRYLAQSGLCDLIVGSHPHVLQPLEYIDGVPILYSLGNFCYSASNYPDNQTVIFRVVLEKGEKGIVTKPQLIPCYVYTGDINNYQPALMPEGEDRIRTLELMRSKVEYQTETTAPTTQPTTEEVLPAPTQQTIYEDEIWQEDDYYNTDEVFQGVPVPY